MYSVYRNDNGLWQVFDQQKQKFVGEEYANREDAAIEAERRRSASHARHRAPNSSWAGLHSRGY